VPAITTPVDDTARNLALRVLGVYVCASTCVHLWHLLHGFWDARLLVVEAAILFAVFGRGRSMHPAWRWIGDWLPLLSLPLLYGGMTWVMIGSGGMHDAVVQAWDRALFGTEPARTFAGALPWWPLSELLHLAYFSYYGIIYGPALFFYLRRGHRRGFHDIVLAFTVTMVSSFVAFSVFPVEGPRYAWPAPAGVPSGPVRSAVLWVLEAGSTRGTAFPSSHVAIALSISLAMLRWRRNAGVGLTVVTVALGLGAVYGGFHYATDILAGAALGGLCWGISRHVHRRSFEIAGKA
jgi:membrane-associated phospholipid phosphatase